MTRQQRRALERRAAQYAGHILAMLESSGASRVVPLSNYRDEADYRVIMGTSEFSFEEWRTLNMATMELLRDGGCVVVLVPKPTRAYGPPRRQSTIDNAPRPDSNTHS